MSIEQTRAYVIAAVWQAIAQSGVDLTAIPQAEQEKLVNKLADNLLQTLDKLLEEATPPPPAPQPESPPEPEDDKAEKMLWEGRPFLSLVEKYVVTSERLKIIKGLIGRDVENFELIRIQDIDLKQTPTERMLGIGDIFILGADKSNVAIVLRNVKSPETLYEILRRAWLDARKRYGLQFREYM